MPLTWNIGEIAMYKDDTSIAYIEREEGGQKYYDLVPVTKTFIFWGGAVAIGEIKESNAAEYYGRSKAIEEITGRSFMEEWKKDENGNWQPFDLFMTMNDVKSHIGLSTNHSTRTLSEWVNNFIRNNKSVSPEAKSVKAIVNYHIYQYNKWDGKYEIAE